MRRLKVLTLTDQLVYLGGGAERVAMEIATRLDQSRFESVFCASRYWEGARSDSVQDAERRMDVMYDEVSEALGEEPGYFDAAEFEENMSTHYGRMIHQDDRTLMFANPEDAAEELGFDLVAN